MTAAVYPAHYAEKRVCRVKSRGGCVERADPPKDAGIGHRESPHDMQAKRDCDRQDHGETGVAKNKMRQNENEDTNKKSMDGEVIGRAVRPCTAHDRL